MRSSATYRLLIIAIALLVFNTSWAGGEKKISFRGQWKFALGDNMKFASPTLDDSEWEKIYVPASWQEEGFSRYSGYAWYRISFDLEFDAKEILYLELGKIDDVDEVYFNGKMIGTTGGFPPDYYTAVNVSRNYLIPNELLQKGRKNVIAVRVYDEGGVGGIMGKNVGIYSYATAYESGISLVGKWKFHLHDDESWAKEAVDEKEWSDVVAPSAWENQGFHDYDGFAWYRKKFTVPANFSTSDLVLLMGRIDDMDEVFINGTLVGGTGKINRGWANDDEYRKPRTYMIPDGVLKAGDNLVAVRVYDQEGVGGIYEGPLAIIPRAGYRDFWKRYQDNEDISDHWWSWEWR
jgi:sialate O-acetylesterase